MNCELYRLRKELNELQKCLEHYEKRIQLYEEYMRNKSSDVQPDRCVKCGILIENGMCYSCPDPVCPCGMGPTTC